MGKQPAAVVGIGQTHHRAKREDVSIAGLCREAIDRALADAGIGFDDIDAVVVGKAPDLFEGVMMPELFLADALGAAGKPLLRVHTAGSVGGSTAIVATSLVQAGVHQRVLTVAFEKQSESNAMWALSIPLPFNMPVDAGAGGYFAPHVRSYIRRSGAPDAHRRDRRGEGPANALKNPYAHLRNPDITVESVLASQMLWDPIRYDETCPSSDGACALVIGDEDTARAVAQPRLDPRHRDAHGGDHGRRARPGEPAGRRATRRRRSGSRPGSPTRSRRSTSPRSTCRSPGSSRCGWRTSASPTQGDGWKLTESGEHGDRTGSSRSTPRAACSPPTRSAPRACCASPRRRCR